MDYKFVLLISLPLFRLKSNLCVSICYIIALYGNKEDCNYDVIALYGNKEDCNYDVIALYGNKEDCNNDVIALYGNKEDCNNDVSTSSLILKQNLILSHSTQI